MKSIDGYYIGTITAAQELHLSMPTGSIPRHVGIQDDSIWIWCEGDWNNITGQHKIFVLGDNDFFSGEEGPYIGTVIHRTEFNIYIWHFYDQKPGSLEMSTIESAIPVGVG